MTIRNILRIALLTALLLLVPLAAMRLTDAVDWSPADFAVAGLLLFCAGLAYELIAKRSGHIAYRAAVGLAVGTALLLVWANLAVGLIGDEDDPANLIYLGVLAVEVIGALIARLRPRGMAHAAFAAALAQVSVIVIARAAGWGDTLLVNGVFAALWTASALLFRRAAAADLEGI